MEKSDIKYNGSAYWHYPNDWWVLPIGEHPKNDTIVVQMCISKDQLSQDDYLAVKADDLHSDPLSAFMAQNNLKNISRKQVVSITGYVDDEKLDYQDNRPYQADIPKYLDELFSTLAFDIRAKDASLITHEVGDLLESNGCDLSRTIKQGYIHVIITIREIDPYFDYCGCESCSGGGNNVYECTSETSDGDVVESMICHNCLFDHKY